MNIDKRCGYREWDVDMYLNLCRHGYNMDMDMPVVGRITKLRCKISDIILRNFIKYTKSHQENWNTRGIKLTVVFCVCTSRIP